MNTINCRIQVEEYTDVPGKDITPAEVIILRHLHRKHANRDPIRSAIRGGVALRNRQPRTDQEEHDRLRLKYPGKNTKTGRPIVEEQIGNEFQRLPQTFDELEQASGIRLQIAPVKEARPEKKQGETTYGASAPPEAAPEKSAAPVAPVITPEQQRETLIAKKKDELVALAQHVGATVTETDTKASLVEKILTESGAAA